MERKNKPGITAKDATDFPNAQYKTNPSPFEIPDISKQVPHPLLENPKPTSVITPLGV